MLWAARHAEPRPSADDSLPPQDPPTLWNSPHYQPVKHPGAIVVAEGLLPVLYNLKRGDRVRVIDVTADKELASATAEGPVIVTVQQTGVFIGDQRFRAGPMAVDHQYRIVLDVGPDQPWRSSVQIAPVREPLATQPAPPERP